MSFYAKRFIFDGIPSEMYSLTISSNDGGEESTDMAGDIKIYSEKLFRRTDEYLLGVSIDPMLKFNVSFRTDNAELRAEDLQLIGKWLFGRRNYAKLKIMQVDMQDLYFECFFTSPEIVRVGNVIVGVNAEVHNRYAWGITPEKTFSYTYTPNAVNETIIHNNMSDDSGYTYPTLTITTDAFGGDISWTNVTDNNRISILTSMEAGEIITLQNDYQIISSSTGLRRLSNFNKNFFRLLSGKNQIILNGACTSFVMKYPLAKKISG